MRSIERIVGCSINTVDKLLRDGGEVVAPTYHDQHVRGVKAVHIQCSQTNEPRDKQVGNRSDRRRLLDVDGDRSSEQAAH